MGVSIPGPATPGAVPSLSATALCLSQQLPARLFFFFIPETVRLWTLSFLHRS